MAAISYTYCPYCGKGPFSSSVTVCPCCGKPTEAVYENENVKDEENE